MCWTLETRPKDGSAYLPADSSWYNNCRNIEQLDTEECSNKSVECHYELQMLSR